MKFVDKNIDSNCGIITLKDSANGNRLHRGVLSELNEVMDNFLADDEVRAILFRSNGKNFCLGMDLSFLENLDKEMDSAKETVALYGDLLDKINEGSKVVISVVNGAVKAGGMGLVAASDIVFASDVSDFQLSEVLLGLVPLNVLPMLAPYRLSVQKARYLILSAKTLTADEAYRLNLVDEVYGEDKLERGVKSLLRNLLRAAPNALAETKRFTGKIGTITTAELKTQAKDGLLEMIQLDDVQGAIAAFAEMEQPIWVKKFKTKNPILLNGE